MSRAKRRPSPPYSRVLSIPLPSSHFFGILTLLDLKYNRITNRGSPKDRKEWSPSHLRRLGDAVDCDSILFLYH
jgi:hypothetical protein